MVSSLLRAVFGLVLVILAIVNYNKNSAGIAAGEPVTLFGATFHAESWQFTTVIGVVVLLGLGLLAAGISGLLKKS